MSISLHFKNTNEYDFTHLKYLFNENEACDTLRDDYLKIAARYDAVKRRNLNSCFHLYFMYKNPA